MARIWTPTDVVTLGAGSDLMLVHDGQTWVFRNAVLTGFDITHRVMDITALGDSWRKIIPDIGTDISLRLCGESVGIIQGEQISRVDLGRYSVLDLMREVNKRVEARN